VHAVLAFLSPPLVTLLLIVAQQLPKLCSRRVRAQREKEDEAWRSLPRAELPALARVTTGEPPRDPASEPNPMYEPITTTNADGRRWRMLEGERVLVDGS
jgi:hypothetical protein